MCGVRSSEYLLKKEMEYISSPINGALRYVRRSFCTGMVSDHLPFLRSLQWYLQIVANRPKDEDNLNDLRGIHDIQNGVFVGTNVHRPFDARRLVILKVRCFCLPVFSRLISASPSVFRLPTIFSVWLTSPSATNERLCHQMSNIRPPLDIY